MRLSLTNARGVEPQDLNPPERCGNGTFTLTEFDGRMQNAEAALHAAHKALDALVTKGTSATAEALRTALLKLAGFGLAPGDSVDGGRRRRHGARDVVAAIGGAPRRQPAAPRSRHAAAHATRRHRSARAARPARRTHARGIRHCVRRAATLHVCGAPRATELASAIGAGNAARGDMLAANTWLSRYARARDPVARFVACMRSAEVLATGERLAPKVAQLPFVAGERWVGLAVGDGPGDCRPASCRSSCRPRRPVDLHAAARRTVDRRMDRERSRSRRDHRHHVPVRPPRFVRAPEHLARGAAGA